MKHAFPAKRSASYGSEQPSDCRTSAASAHALAYVTVNLLLVAIWYTASAGFFWPVFPIFGWGIGLAFNAWDVLWPAAGEQRIEAEMERLRRAG